MFLIWGFYYYLQLVFSQTFNMAPCNQQHRSMDSAMDVRITSSDPGSVAPVRKIAKKKKRVRLDRPTANGKLHVDFKVVKPIVPKGRNAKKFCRELTGGWFSRRKIQLRNKDYDGL
ncbi:hypothetical protein Ddye_019433 [Dipteronia dyeriana]|uniref:Uncharacterized protein n=1 Tax=Dipteronia dyeriana TaxID=168575 RepID=A0AAD9WVM1_9ROSI|nr:hypothetical protein Ddye_019433 [Dipteronia dyeriana]